ncbi:HEAT repeat domain-containing protein [Roseofilum casamattae]|uniref:HEAT repeat domain-containing protein n=1 Tax=Roseofilum casamattae BLCC-M143 TaxID=3022442 RepID=A0ABT7C3N4_9CYAN|nr:HEAT repeat domain-containing protein [Roseofilum casamattae]MDJ1185213.1 HEAT repeat domain-containing protein [Roseofilum casamattae BLCC-M143]
MSDTTLDSEESPNSPFNLSEVEAYIHGWFRDANAPEVGAELWETVQSGKYSYLQNAIAHPAELLLLCLLWNKEQSLPEMRSQLYAKLADALYEWKLETLPAESQKQELHQKLGRLALRAMNVKDEEGDFSQFELPEHWLPEEFGSLENNSCQLALQVGWLQEGETNEKTYQFYSSTFAEYFAAFAIASRDYFLPQDHKDYPIPGKEYRIFEDRWKPVILFWLGREDVESEQKEAFVWTLVQFEDGCCCYGYRAFWLAATGINEFKSCSLADAIAQQIVQWSFGHFDTNKQKWSTVLHFIRKGATEVLLETNSNAAIKPLCNLLTNSQSPEYTRQGAARTLWDIAEGNPEAIATLLEILGSNLDGNTRLRRLVLKTLGQIAVGNSEAIATLVEIICSSSDADLRRRVVTTLENIDSGNLHAIAALEKMLDSDSNVEIRRLAARSLEGVTVGSPQTIGILLETVRYDSDAETRRHAICSLGFIAVGNSEAIATLIEIACFSPEEQIYKLAGRSLEQIAAGNPDAIAVLAKIASSNSDRKTRYRAAWCLGRIDPGNPEAIAALVEILRCESNVETRREAAHSLGKIAVDNPEAIAALVKILHCESNVKTRQEAAHSLGKIAVDNPEAIVALVEILRCESNVKTRQAAAHSLGKIAVGNSNAIAALADIVRSNSNPVTRKKAVNALLQITTTLEHRKYISWKPPKPITVEQQKHIVSVLQPFLDSETHETDIYLFTNCYQRLWDIARNLSYPDFYEAWQGSRPG